MSRGSGIWSGMRSHVPGIAWPPLTTQVSAALVGLVRYLDDAQWMSAGEIEARQYEQLCVLAAHAARQSPLFRRRLSQASLSADDLASPERMHRLAPLRRRDLQTSGSDLYCADVPASHNPVLEARTSGSTGEPVVVRRTAINQLFWLAMTMRDHLWSEDDFSQRFSAIRPTFSSYAELRDWGEPASLLFHTGAGQMMPITAETKQHVAWIAGFRPHILLSFPSIIGAIAAHCRQHGVELPGLGAIRTVGETIHPYVRQEAQATLSVRIRDIYSSNEVGTIALQCPKGVGYHTMAESLIVEVIDGAGRPCRDGEVGRLVITDLHNFATPLVRYDIGDYAEAAGPCSCGRGLPALRRIVGRERNLILMPDGTRRYPLVGFGRFRDVAPISQYQLVQHDPRDLEVRLVAESPLSAKQEIDLGDIIQGALGAAFDLRFTYFAEGIPRGSGGKFEEFICRVPVQAV